MNYNEELYAEMHGPVLNILRRAKKPMVATQIAKLLGYRPAAVLYCLVYKWKDEVIKFDTIPVTFKAK